MDSENKNRLREQEYEDILCKRMNEALVGTRENGSIRECEVDLETMQVKFTFDIIEIPEDNYIGFSGY
jgi:hypothetical protein